jgi:formate-dependent nitrite reductase membrane component NrfD
LKMSLILLAGLNALLFTVMAHRRVLALGPDEDTDTFTKVTAGLSLALWLGVILLGRLLPAFEGSTSFF